MTEKYLFVFIHGAMHGKWAFERKLLPLFEKSQYRAIAFDLPGSGEDYQTPYEDITIANYMNCTLSVIENNLRNNDGQDEKVILVAHSLGGLTATLVAEKIPEKIHCVVYIAAFYFPDPPQYYLPDLSIVKDFCPTEDLKYFILDPENAKEAFYHDCEEADIAFAKSKIRLQSRTPMFEIPQINSDIIKNKVNKYYITTLQDKTIIPSIQELMYKDDIDNAIEMDTSHSPFLSKPDELFNILISLAK
ncbi:Alpha/Beta hydrolase protein [Cunninghamella echinulata]|nr:Alpha/Beta hydrolase protein [Cunninghamella echinulata]